MGELTHDEQTAALEGWSTNPSVRAKERLQAAQEVIDRLRAREGERIRAAVVETLRYVRTSWALVDDSDARVVRVGDLVEAEAAVRLWDMEPSWSCPLCEEVACDEDCPLARVRGGLE